MWRRSGRRGDGQGGGRSGGRGRGRRSGRSRARRRGFVGSSRPIGEARFEHARHVGRAVRGRPEAEPRGQRRLHRRVQLGVQVRHRGVHVRRLARVVVQREGAHQRVHGRHRPRGRLRLRPANHARVRPVVHVHDRARVHVAVETAEGDGRVALACTAAPRQLARRAASVRPSVSTLAHQNVVEHVRVGACEPRARCSPRLKACVPVAAKAPCCASTSATRAMLASDTSCSAACATCTRAAKMAAVEDPGDSPYRRASAAASASDRSAGSRVSRLRGTRRRSKEDAGMPVHVSMDAGASVGRMRVRAASRQESRLIHRKRGLEELRASWRSRTTRRASCRVARSCAARGRESASRRAGSSGRRPTPACSVGSARRRSARAATGSSTCDVSTCAPRTTVS